MDKLALLYRVPIIVVKYSDSFIDYVVVAAAIYGDGSKNQMMICLVHVGDDKFDLLELNTQADKYARRIYRRIYENILREPGHYAHHIKANNDDDDDPESDTRSNYTKNSNAEETRDHQITSDEDDDDNKSVSSVDGDDESASSMAGDLEQALPPPLESGDQAAIVTSPMDVSGMSGSTKSTVSLKRDGYVFESSIHSAVSREHQICDKQYYFTNVVSIGRLYKYSDPVKVKEYPAGR